MALVDSDQGTAAPPATYRLVRSPAVPPPLPEWVAQGDDATESHERLRTDDAPPVFCPPPPLALCPPPPLIAPGDVPKDLLIAIAQAPVKPASGASPVLRTAPAWLVSLMIHLGASVLLAAISLPIIIHQHFEIYAETVGEQLLETEMTAPEPIEMSVELPALAFDEAAIEEPLAAPPIELVVNSEDPDKGPAFVEMPGPPPPVGMALSGRSPGKKVELLVAYGGTQSTEEAVHRGLEWLKYRQEENGSWSLRGKYKNGGHSENRVAATAMALIAFQGAGSTHEDGEYSESVKRGWAYLLKQQKTDGAFRYPGAPNATLYSHALATIAICEIYGMTKDSNIRLRAQRALDYCFSSQGPDGGWRYTPYQPGDVSVTGWFVMAMQSGRMAGLEVESAALEGASKFLDSCSSDGGAKYGYQAGDSGRPSLTAEGLLCRQYMGWNHDSAPLRRGVDYLHEYPIGHSEKNVYYWYYATQVFHHMGGTDWDRWNKVMRQKIPQSQVKTGPDAGSWSPAGDRWGNQGGRLYQTCLSIYMLEVYYRHLPIYKYRLEE